MPHLSSVTNPPPLWRSAGGIGCGGDCQWQAIQVPQSGTASALVSHCKCLSQASQVPWLATTSALVPCPRPPRLKSSLPVISRKTPHFPSHSLQNPAKPVRNHAKCAKPRKKSARTFCRDLKSPYLCTRFPKGRQSQRRKTRS